MLFSCSFLLVFDWNEFISKRLRVRYRNKPDFRLPLKKPPSPFWRRRRKSLIAAYDSVPASKRNVGVYAYYPYGQNRKHGESPGLAAGSESADVVDTQRRHGTRLLS